ncbi:PEP-CTERM system TPR-repeat protein PrsT [Thalassomonas viridans]|uniref:PEP-CTERM system TPR-repeat protein PrsT n=1 Tax=Thalassomonas viridans TaxID=137584 RepID=A0AAE9Z4B3_9GAMM|nr:XrtA/PEP-CTERM system TPR-repeat protein PrsT [Thalassomonas viridans]WDE05003.1 PEP-CTERM system TPR-repeat protein PrsT [Thalassomonas viridans]
MKNANKLLFATSLMLAASACTPQKTAEEQITEAKAQIAQQQLSTASIALKNVLKSSPKSAEGRFLLSQVYLKTGELDNAEKEVKKALEYGYEAEAANLLLAEILLEKSENQAVIDLLAGQKFSTESAQILSFIFKGKAHINLNQIELAKDAFDTANDINVESSYSLYGSAIVASMDDNYQLAAELLDKALAQQDDLAEGWILKARVAEQNKDFTTAVSAYEKFLQLRPRAHSIKLLMANDYLQLEDHDAAEKLVDDLLKLNEAHPTANLLKAKIANSKKDYALVKKHAEAALNITPEDPLALYLSGISNYFLNNFEQAYTALSKIVERLPKTHEAHKLYMLSMLKLGYVDQLNEHVEGYEGFDDKDSNLLSVIGSSLAVSGQTKDAESIFERALEVKPDDINAKKKLAFARLMNRDLQGISDLEEVSAISSDDKMVNLVLASAYLYQNKIEEANDIIEKWLAKEPKDIEALLLKSRVLGVSGDQDASLAVLKEAESYQPDSVKVLLKLAEHHLRALQYPEAESLLKKILAANPDTRAALVMLNLASEKQEKGQQFFDYLTDISNKHSEAIWPKLMLAQKLINDKEAEQALKYLAPLAQQEQLPNAYYSIVMNGHFLLSDKAKLNDVAGKWQAANPQAVVAYLKHIEFLEKFGDIQSALLQAQKAQKKVTKASDNLRLMVLETHYLLRLGRNNKVAPILAKLQDELPDNALVTQLAGHLAFNKKQYGQAISHLEQSFAKDSNVRTALLLASAYRRNNDEAKAVTFLEQAPEKVNQNAAVQSLLSEMYTRTDTAKAIDSYLKQIKASPKNVVALNNLAWLLTEQKKYDQAIGYARKAHELMPDNPQILDTLGVALLKNIKQGEALEILKKAYSLSKDASIKVHYAQALAANGQKNEARQVLDGLTAKEKSDLKEELEQLVL